VTGDGRVFLAALLLLPPPEMPRFDAEGPAGSRCRPESSVSGFLPCSSPTSPRVKFAINTAPLIDHDKQLSKSKTVKEKSISIEGDAREVIERERERELTADPVQPNHSNRTVNKVDGVGLRLVLVSFGKSFRIPHLFYPFPQILHNLSQYLA
jgi:hypothetical protein